MSNNTSIYIGKQKPKVLKIVKKILRKNQSKIYYPNSWKIINKGKAVFYKDKENQIKIKSNYIHSKGLIDNLGLAIKIALDLKIKPKLIENTIPKIKFDGRLEFIKKGKLRRYLNRNEKLLIDGAHSNASAQNLKNYLKNINGPIYGIWGMQRNKMPEKFINNFKGIFKKIITLKIPSEPNSCSAEELKNILHNKGYTKAISTNSILGSFKEISNKTKKTIVVFGSLYLCGEFLKRN
tara:strand:- start:65 stop:775 length:711 start_codon:yes stop_codon:yes gene_type:complete